MVKSGTAFNISTKLKFTVKMYFMFSEIQRDSLLQIART